MKGQRVGAVDVPCPDCGAPVGSVCTTSTGNFRRPHTSRVLKFRQVEMFEPPKVTPVGNVNDLLRRVP